MSTVADAAVVEPSVDAASPGESPQDASNKSLDLSLIRSVAWTGAAKWTVQVLTWIATLAVARFLAPEDYGLVGMATVFLGLVALLSEFGIGITVVTLRDLTEREIAQLNGLAVLFGVTAYCICAAAAVPLSHFFHSSQLPPVIWTLSVTFIISALRIVPGSLLARGLDFRRLAVIEACHVVVQSATVLVLAWRGFGYWSLVIGNVIGQLAATAITLARTRHRFDWPRGQALRSALTFTRHQTTSSLAWYGYSSVDVAIAGRVLGPWSVGVYSMALTLARTFPEKTTSLIVRVTPAFFSAVQHDIAALRRYVLRLSEYLAIITFPAMLGLALTANEVVSLLGEQWQAAAMPLRLLALFAAYESILQLLTRALTATRETRFIMRDQLALVCVMPAALLLGSKWGPTGLAATWLLVHPVTRIPIIRRACRKLEMTAAQYLRVFVPAIGGCACMTAVLLLVRPALQGWQASTSLMFQAAIGALAYATYIMLLHRTRVTALIQAITSSSPKTS
jgi:O-antigen/teichoic acid export membrane protein